MRPGKGRRAHEREDVPMINHVKTCYMAYGFAFPVPASLYRALIK